MGKTKIEWCDFTFNPWIGCAKVSDGCKNCYAERLMDERYGRAQWGPNGTRVKTSEKNWLKPIAWNKQAGQAGTRYKVFCASLADVFEDREELESWREDLFTLIQQTPYLNWLILTKRPENVKAIIEDLCWEETGCPMSALPENVWIGTSIENQETADERIQLLLSIPAKVHFLSIEPLLGPINLPANLKMQACNRCQFTWPGTVNCPMCGQPSTHEGPGIDWVIVGGESGPNARPMHPDWVRSLRDQCIAAGVPFFFKQWGEYQYYESYPMPLKAFIKTTYYYEASSFHKIEKNTAAEKLACFPLATKSRKHASGRLLDGMEWNEMPCNNLQLKTKNLPCLNS